MMIEETLKKIGLGKTEVVVYLALLELGTAQASTIAYRTNLHRTNVRHICWQLVKKGLVYMSPKGNTYLFSPESPEKLSFIIQKKQEDLEHQQEMLQGIMGELKAKKILIQPCLK